MGHKKQAVIVDMDGTLANVSGIRHLVRPAEGRRFKDFDAFHRESVNVPANPEVVAQVREFAARGIDVVIVTARRARWRHHTAWWLALHGVPSVAMFMRADGDGRPDVEVKRDILARIRGTWDVVAAIDDNPAVIEGAWKPAGIPLVVHVPGWEVP